MRNYLAGGGNCMRPTNRVRTSAANLPHVTHVLTPNGRRDSNLVLGARLPEPKRAPALVDSARVRAATVFCFTFVLCAAKCAAVALLGFGAPYPCEPDRLLIGRAFLRGATR